jgi:hypothetical protein
MGTFFTRPGDPSRAGGGQRRWRRLSAAAGVVIGMVMCTDVPAWAASGPSSAHRVSFGIAPASASAPDGRPHFAIGATPGATVFDHVVALNYSSVPLSLQVYATDAIETTDGGFGLLPADVKPTEAGSWISLPSGSSTVDVPAETPTGPGQVVIPITVRIPIKATPGDHVGGIIASLQTEGSNRSGQKVILVQRVGTRVFIRVSGALAPKLALTDEHASYQGTFSPVGQGRVKVSYLVSNTGNVDLALDHQSVSISALIGSTRRVKLANVPLLLPGTSIVETAVVPRVWPEFLVHESESVQPLASGAGVSPLAPVTAGTGVWAIPWTLLGIIVLLVLLAFLWKRVRARRANPVPGSPAQVVVA